MDEIVGKVTRAFWDRFKRDRRYMHQDVVDRINDAVASSMTAHIAALEAAGWALMPVEPTEEMVVAGCRHENMGDMAGRYKAMLAVRPRLGEDE